MAGEIVPTEDLPGNVVPQGDLPQAIQDADSAGAVSNILDAVRDYGQPAFNLVKKSALPLAGGIAGGAATTAIGAGPIPGYMAGSGLGEIGNQMLGITEPSPTDVVLATTMPAIASATIGTMKLVGGSLLKAFGGRQAVADIASSIAGRLFSPKVSSEELFSRALASTAPINATRAATAIDDVLRTEAAQAPTQVNEAIINAVKPLELYFKHPQRSITQIDAAVKDLRLAASAAYKSGNSRLGNALSSIRNALFDDAEASGITALKEASKAYRKESAVEELAGVLRQAQPMKAFKDLQDKNALFRNVFNESEKTQIESIMRRLATSAPSGFSGVLGRAISGGVGAKIAGPAGAVAGGMLPDAAAYALSTQAGRRFMGKLLIGEGVWDAPKTAALLTWTRAQMAEDAQAGEIADRVKQTLKDSTVNIDDKIRTVSERDEIINAVRGAVAY